MIEANNLTRSFVNQSFLKKVARKVLKGENKEGVKLSLALVGQARIRQLNRKYRGKNRVTDVLSFQGDGGGEIVICLSQVKRNAKKYQITFKKELTKVLIHGILHVLGYEHGKRLSAADKMRQKEEHYLSQVLKI